MGPRRPLLLGSITNLDLRSTTQGDYDIWVDNFRVEPAVADGLIDDFTSSSAPFAGYWWSSAGTGATATFVTATDAGNPAGHFSGTTPWDSWGLAGRSFTTPVDLTSSTGISFDVHGTAKLGFGSGANALIPKNNADCPIGTDQIPTDTCAIDKGLLFSPYTDGYAGAAPDLGAFESGKPKWTAGATTVENWYSCPAGPAPADCTITLDAGTYTAGGGKDAWPTEGGADGSGTVDSVISLGPMDASAAGSPVIVTADAAPDAQSLDGGAVGADTAAAKDARVVDGPTDSRAADVPSSAPADASSADSAARDSRRDSQTSSAAPVKSSGCGCRVGGRGRAQSSLPFVILAGLPWIVMARRRRGLAGAVLQTAWPGRVRRRRSRRCDLPWSPDRWSRLPDATRGRRRPAASRRIA